MHTFSAAQAVLQKSSAEPISHCIYGLPTAAFLAPASTGLWGFSSSRLLSPAETLDQEQGLSHSQHLILCVVMSCSEHAWTRFSLRSHKPGCTLTAEIMELLSAQLWRWMLRVSSSHVCLLCCPNGLPRKKHQCLNEKICLHISLIHSQPNTHHLLQSAVHTIKGFIFVLHYLSVIMECLSRAAFLCVCLKKWGICHFLHFLLYHLHFPFCPHIISCFPSIRQPAPLR